MKDKAPLTKTFTLRGILGLCLPIVAGIAAGVYVASGALDIAHGGEGMQPPRLIASKPFVFPENEEMLDTMGKNLRAEMDFVTPFDPAAIEPAAGDEFAPD